MQSNTLSVRSICSLLKRRYKPLSHIKVKKIGERQRTDRRINNANSFSLPNKRERDKQNQKKSLRLTRGQWPLLCNISPDYHLIVNNQSRHLISMIGQWTWYCAILSLTNQITWCLHHWVTPPKINQSEICHLAETAFIYTSHRPFEDSVSEFLPRFARPRACQP